MRVRALVVLILALLGSTSAGMTLPPDDFFVDPETGEPNVIIVVGSKAAVMDVVSATMLAAAIGARVTEVSDGTSSRVDKAIHKNVNPFLAASEGKWTDTRSGVEALGFPTVDVPDAGVYQQWELNSTPITYTLESLWYFDDLYEFWGNNDGNFDPWETHEEIQVRFDDLHKAYDIFFPFLECAPCLLGGDVPNALRELDNVSAWYTTPGLIYRADNIFVPPMVGVKTTYVPPEGNPASLDLNNTVYVPEPLFVMQGRLPQFKLFNTVYTVVDAGPVFDMNCTTGEQGPLHGTPYIVTGEPHFEKQIYLHGNELMKFFTYTVEIVEVDVEYDKVRFQVSQNGEILDTFWLPGDRYTCGFPGTLEQKLEDCRSLGFSPLVYSEDFNAYDTWNDIDGDGELDPGEFTHIVDLDYDKDGTADYHKWVVHQVEKSVWAYYTWVTYTDDDGNSWVLFDSVDFILDYRRIFVGAHGTFGAEIIVYWIENKEYWYNHLCCDPWVAEPDYQLFIDAYESEWDDTDTNSYVYQPPGTGLWPPAGRNTWVKKVGNSIFLGNGFLDNNDGHTGYEYALLAAFLPDVYFPEQYDFDRDSDVTCDCRTDEWKRMEQCTDLSDVEDPAVWHGPNQIMVEINVLSCETLCGRIGLTWSISGPREDLPYFTIVATDVYFCSEGSIDYDTILVTTTEVTIVLDTELDLVEWKSACDCSLVLVGGPAVNNIVKQLVSEGISTVYWEASPGEWEYIKAPFGGCDVLIVAGADRGATRAAVQLLIDGL